METALYPSQDLVTGKRKHALLWAFQIVLALVFGALGGMKLFMSSEALADLMIWPGLIPEGLVRFNGAAELLGALGLVLPGLTGIKTWLTCYAGYGLTVIMIMAMGFHMSHSGWYLIFPNLLLAGMALFVGIGRMEDHTPLPQH
jgi:hypothetical protein